MYVSEFVSLALLALALTFTLWAVLLSLKCISWKSRNGLLLDAFFLWVTWILSSALAFVLLAVVDHNLQISLQIGYLSPGYIALVIICLCSVSSVAAAMYWLTQRRIEDKIAVLDEAAIERVNVPEILIKATFVTLAAVMTLASTIGMLHTAEAAYDYFFPRPTIRYAIYDI